MDSVVGIFQVLLFVFYMVSPTDLTPTVNKMDQRTCQYEGQEFKVGEQVTQDACDRCFCSQYGILCELIACPEVKCQDKVMGECCYECPNGPNCLFNGEQGSVLVPETGCTYTEGTVCYCYHDNKTTAMETICWPALPGDEKPKCNQTSI